MSVDLRFSDVDPPAREPQRTVYADIVNLPDPVKLGLTVRIFNYDDVALYMKVDGYNASWAFTSKNLGYLASGTNSYYNLDEFGTRDRPSGEMSEATTVRLRAYTDAGYTDLKWTFERSVNVSFIKSDDGSWTEDVVNNFDDGTIQGWAVANETGNRAGWPTITVRTSYVLSPPYSVAMKERPYTGGAGIEMRGRFYKSFATPARANVYGIVDLRIQELDPTSTKIKNIQVKKDGVVLIFIGKPYFPTGADEVPPSRWLRLVFPLPMDTTFEMRFSLSHYTSSDGSYMDFYMDDFRIISKD